MRNDRFEWDDAKAAGNLAKHKVSFEFASLVFGDPRFLEDADPYEGEERTRIIGMVHGRLVFVVYAVTDAGRLRLITARKAIPDEQDRYTTEAR